MVAMELAQNKTNSLKLKFSYVIEEGAHPGLMKMRMSEEMTYPSDLAPLAPLRGEGPGERGLERASLHRHSQYVGARCPLIPSPSPPQSGLSV
jgi:hypothetical protein